MIVRDQLTCKTMHFRGSMKEAKRHVLAIMILESGYGHLYLPLLVALPKELYNMLY